MVLFDGVRKIAVEDAEGFRVEAVGFLRSVGQLKRDDVFVADVEGDDFVVFKMVDHLAVRFELLCLCTRLQYVAEHEDKDGEEDDVENDKTEFVFHGLTDHAFL